MPAFTTHDGIELFYKDWGAGQTSFFHHGGPLSADVSTPHSEQISAEMLAFIKA